MEATAGNRANDDWMAGRWRPDIEDVTDVEVEVMSDQEGGMEAAKVRKIQQPAKWRGATRGRRSDSWKTVKWLPKRLGARGKRVWEAGVEESGK